jgi:hypothetical protein
MQRTEIENLNDDTRQRLHNSCAVAAQTQQLAADTAVELKLQGEQMSRMQEDLDEIRYQEKIAERHTRSIKSIWGTIANFFTPAPKRPDDAQRVNDIIAARKAEEQRAQAKAQEKAQRSSAKKNAVPFKIEPASKEDADMEEMLDDLSAMVTNLHDMSLAMGREIDDHNIRLAVIRDTTEEANIDLRNVDSKVVGLIRK